MPYTNVSKPTGSSYTKLSKGDDKFFDDTNVDFDANVFFDGISNSLYTNISKPTSSVYTKLSKPT